MRGLNVHYVSCKLRDVAFDDPFKKRPREEEMVESEHWKRSRKGRQGGTDHHAATASSTSNMQRAPSPLPMQVTEDFPWDPTPPPAAVTRTGRCVRVPKIWDDYVPSSKTGLPSQLASMFPKPAPEPTPPPHTQSDKECPDPTENLGEDEWETPPDDFGGYRRYTEHLPQHDPLLSLPEEVLLAAPGLGEGITDDARGDQQIQSKYKSTVWMTLSLAVKVEEEAEEPITPSTTCSSKPQHGPFLNVSQFRLTDHYYSCSDTHSQDNFDDMIHVITSNGFDPNDLQGFNTCKAEQLLDSYWPVDGVFSGGDGWVKGAVNVPLPKTFSKHKNGAASMDKYHWIGHHLFWDPSRAGANLPVPESAPTSSGMHSSTGPQFSFNSTPPPDPICVFTDCYNLDAHLAEEAELRKKERIQGDVSTVEYVILPLLFWSDATALSNFGTASLWPIYVYFGNLLKYICGRPTEFAVQHSTYIPALDDAFKEFYKGIYSKYPTEDVQHFCKRALFTQIWLLLLDDDFINAYKNGILLTCGNRVVRRVFP
ncbi:hypothetical protein C8Q80DRAFT_1274766 [Daedaleopsis nitida]|nr:hypothetical protein C8Q80DRAFT_1274766 [Daedaleopsis nitida]